ncbi:DUF1194 domain-containing protein [Sinisalibacter aestuarii]|nr:DUF1194 domain-containing protein [Sinisalibacter aestuarii]
MANLSLVWLPATISWGAPLCTYDKPGQIAALTDGRRGGAMAGLAEVAMLRAIFIALALAALPLAGAAAPCRQALALGLDVSGSVDEAEYRMQLDGLAAALTHPEVARALVEGAGVPVHLLVYEWSGPRDQRIVAEWTAITDAAALARFADTLRATRRVPAAPSTALGTALATGASLLAGQSACWTRTLDISGDGLSNAGPRPQDIDLPALDGVTVNALVIGTGEGQRQASAGYLLGYFETNVIRGPGAFAEQAEGFADYERAMVRKLLRELEGLVIGRAEPAQ